MRVFLILLFIVKTFEARAELPVGCNPQDLLPLKMINEQSSKWFFPKNKDKPLAQVFLFHGLNTRPSAMNPIVQFLNENGAQVLRGTLSGHDHLETWKSLGSENWISDFKKHYCLSLIKAKEHKIPHFYIGYSLGALLPLYFQQIPDYKLEIDKLVLIAPPIATYWYTQTFRTLFFLSDRAMIPSLNMPEYRAHKGTSLAAYRSLYSLKKTITNGDWSANNHSALVFLAANDNLVNSTKVEKLIKNKGLNKWEIIDISTQDHQFKKNRPHLCIDKPSLGGKEWNKMQRGILKYFGLQDL